MCHVKEVLCRSREQTSPIIPLRWWIQMVNKLNHVHSNEQFWRTFEKLIAVMVEEKICCFFSFYLSLFYLLFCVCVCVRDICCLHYLHSTFVTRFTWFTYIWFGMQVRFIQPHFQWLCQAWKWRKRGNRKKLETRTRISHKAILKRNGNKVLRKTVLRSMCALCMLLMLALST